MLNLTSFGLGLCAWALGAMAVRKYGGMFSLGSMSCCALALVLQLFEVRRRVVAEDLAGLMDTVPALSSVAAVLLIITVALNLTALVRSGKER